MKRKCYNFRSTGIIVSATDDEIYSGDSDSSNEEYHLF